MMRAASSSPKNLVVVPAVRAATMFLAAMSLVVLAACSGGEAPPPPPPQGAQLPAGQVLITVAAGSSPQGATVTGGGQMLGLTPFTTQVPIPIAQPGQTQTFQFTFQLPGYQSATVTASPINNTITLNAALAPMVVAGNAPTDPGGAAGTPTEGTGESFTVRGPAGGRIRDNHTTTSAARVAQSCVIDSLDVDVDGSHSYFGDLVVSLRGPDGTNYPLQSRASRNPFRSYAVRRAAGHPSQGVWTLAVADNAGADSGNLSRWSMTVRCR